LFLTIMMEFDTIVSILVKHDVICFKLGKRHKLCCCFLSDVVIPWTALASSQSKTLATKLTNLWPLTLQKENGRGRPNF
jgi:hypothetical protein